MEHSTTIYRKYRPSNFSSIAGHKNVVEILTKQLETNKIGQSFLFAGQRGTGKTSIARILAKSVNCSSLQKGLSCEKCESCTSADHNKNPDIIEMDAASNNGVDEIREIKSNVSTLPLLSKYKVYIIDEVHMLTKAAFNALLKTLEEPPAHAIFILATTEYAKIPPTILSRCQIFNFKKIDKQAVKQRLNFIANKEGFKIEEEVLNEIAILCDGSLRDASNMIEQLMSIAEENITIHNLKTIFSVASKPEKIELILNIVNKEPKKIIEYFEKANNQGMDFDVLTLSLIEIVKEMIEYKFVDSHENLSVLDINDLKDLKNIEIKLLFKIADNLSEAYAKTKGTNINFNYLLINVLKTLEDSFGLNEVNNVFTNKQNEINSKQNFEQEQEVSEKNIKYKTMEADQVKFKHEQTKEIIEPISNEPQFIKEEYKEKSSTFNQEIHKEVRIASFANTPTALKIDISKAIMQKDSKKTYVVTVQEVINLLIGADKQKREINEKKLNDIFKIDSNGEFVDAKMANLMSSLFEFKVIASSSNEILLRHANFENVNNLVAELLDNHFRDSLVQVFGEAIILPIDEVLWNDVKLEFKKLKQENRLGSYIQKDYIKYYQLKKQLIIHNSIDQKTLDAASQLFDLSELEVEG